MKIMRRYIKKPRCGFTLIESMLAISLLTVAAGGILLPFTAGAAIGADAGYRTLGSNLADAMKEQLLSMDYATVLNWDGYSEDSGEIKDSKGVVFSDDAYRTLSREVSCDEVYLAQQSGNSDAVIIKIIVNVYRDSKLIAISTGLKSK